MQLSEIDGIFYDYNKSSTVKLSNEMYNDFCKCCEQEHYSYEVLSKTTDYVVCNADYRIIEFFIKVKQSTIAQKCGIKSVQTVAKVDNGYKGTSL